MQSLRSDRELLPEETRRRNRSALVAVAPLELGKLIIGRGARMQVVECGPFAGFAAALAHAICRTGFLTLARQGAAFQLDDALGRIAALTLCGRCIHHGTSSSKPGSSSRGALTRRETLRTVSGGVGAALRISMASSDEARMN